MLAFIAAGLNVAQTWRRRWTTRRALRSLDAHDLDDIGRSENDRRHECSKWFWQA